MRNVGYINNVTRIGSYTPSNGFVTRVRIRSGNNPAPVRVTILQCSPGLCGTAVRFSRVFRPRANRVSTFNMALRLVRSSQASGRGQLAVSDAVALSAVGPGTLPLSDQGTAGTFSSGSALTQLWYPLTTLNEPRIEGHTIDGVELLMQWRFQRTNPPLLR